MSIIDSTYQDSTSHSIDIHDTLFAYEVDSAMTERILSLLPPKASVPEVGRADSPSEIFSPSSTINPELTQHIQIEPKELEQRPSTDFLTPFIILLLIYYIYTLYRFRENITTPFRTAFSINKTLIAYKTKSNAQTQLGWHCTLLFIGSLALTMISLVFQFRLDLKLELSLWLIFLITMGVAGLYLLYRYAVIGITRILGADKTATDNIRAINRHTITLFITIFTPFSLIASFSSTSLALKITLLTILWLYYLIRLGIILKKSGFGKIHWLLYLCAVEFLPVSYIIAIFS